MAAEPWQRLEDEIYHTLKKWDTSTRKTRGSGRFKDGDIRNNSLVIEAKWRNDKRYIFQDNVWSKVCSEADRLNKQPVIVCGISSSLLRLAMIHDRMLSESLPRIKMLDKHVGKSSVRLLPQEWEEYCSTCNIPVLLVNEERNVIVMEYLQFLHVFYK